MFHLPQVKFNPSESVSPCLIKIRKQLRMGLFSDLQNRLRNSGFWIFGALLMIYFAFHAINGDRGLLKYLYLRQEIAEAQKIAGHYNSQKLKLEEKVNTFQTAVWIGFARRTGAYCAEFGRAGRVYYS